MALVLTPEMLAILAASDKLPQEMRDAIAAEKVKADAVALNARIAVERDADTKATQAKLDGRKDLVKYLEQEAKLAEVRRTAGAIMAALVAARPAIEAADSSIIFNWNKEGDGFTVSSKAFAEKYPNATNVVAHRTRTSNGTSTHDDMLEVVKAAGKNGIKSKDAVIALRQKRNLPDTANYSVRDLLATEITSGTVVQINGFYTFQDAAKN